MKHPWDKTKNKEVDTIKEYDSYFLMTGFKADKNKKSYEKNRVRDRYGAKERKRLKEEKELKQ